MTPMPVWQRWWVQTVIALGIAVLVPFFTNKLCLTTSLREEIFLGIGTWVIGMIFQIACSLHSFHVDRLENKHVLDVITEGDCLLLELQSRFREIAARRLSGKPNQVFIDYCRRSLEHSLNVARRAAQRGELEVHDHHFSTVETVLAAFDGCQDRTFRCVWLIEDDEILFDQFWREYMACLVKLSREQLINRHRRVQVRILFILEDPEQLKRESVKTVLGFVSAEKGFEYHLMLQEDYKSRWRDGGLDEQYLDFGVYGDHLLFLTKSYEPNVGVFIDDPTVIQKYRKMHNTAMAAAPSSNLPYKLPEKVSLEQFLDCDSADAVSEVSEGRGVEQ